MGGWSKAPGISYSHLRRRVECSIEKNGRSLVCLILCFNIDQFRYFNLDRREENKTLEGCGNNFSPNLKFCMCAHMLAFVCDMVYECLSSLFIALIF